MTIDVAKHPTHGRDHRVAMVHVAILVFVVAGIAALGRLGAGDAAGDDTEVLSGILAAPVRSNGASTPGQGQPTTPGNGHPAPPGGDPRTFGISGSLDRIHPNFAGALRVTFTNPHNFDIVVDALDITPAAPDATACTTALAGALGSIVQLDDELPSGGVRVPKQTGRNDGTAHLDVQVTVSNDLPNTCQDVSFPLTYTGTATRANQR